MSNLSTKEFKNAEDRHLSALAAVGDKEAFAELYKMYFKSLCNRVAFHFCKGNENDAEEIVQNAFIQAFRYIHTFEQNSLFGSWITKIARHEVSPYYARISRRLEFNAVSYTEGLSNDVADEDHRIADGLQGMDHQIAYGLHGMITEPDTPSEILERLETLDLAQTTIEAIRNVPGKCGSKGVDLLMRMTDEDLQYADLAEQDNIPIGTVRSRIFRAREALEKEFARRDLYASTAFPSLR